MVTKGSQLLGTEVREAALQRAMKVTEGRTRGFGAEKADSSKRQ